MNGIIIGLVEPYSIDSKVVQRDITMYDVALDIEKVKI